MEYKDIEDATIKNQKSKIKNQNRLIMEVKTDGSVHLRKNL
jgi:hypothetical protein